MKFIFKILVTVFAFLIAYGYFLHGITPVEMYNQLMNDLEPSIETEETLTETQELYAGVKTFVTVNYLSNIYEFEYTGLKYDYWPIDAEEKTHYIPFGILFFEDKGLELGITGGSITSLTIVSNGEISESEYAFFVATMPMIEMFDYNDIIIVDIIIEQEQEGWEL